MNPLKKCPLCKEMHRGSGWACSDCHSSGMTKGNYFYWISQVRDKNVSPTGQPRHVNLYTEPGQTRRDYKEIEESRSLKPKPSLIWQDGSSPSWENAIKIIEGQG